MRDSMREYCALHSPLERRYHYANAGQIAHAHAYDSVAQAAEEQIASADAAVYSMASDSNVCAHSH